MGTYNTQYRDYYDNMRRKNYSSYRYGNSNNGLGNNTNEGHFGKRIVLDLIGVLVLFLMVIGCKTIRTPKTQAAYIYCKNVVNENYDYKQGIEKIKNFNYQEFENKAVNFIDEMKAKFTISKDIEGKVEDNLVMPVNENKGSSNENKK